MDTHLLLSPHWQDDVSIFSVHTKLSYFWKVESDEFIAYSNVVAEILMRS